MAFNTLSVLLLVSFFSVTNNFVVLGNAVEAPGIPASFVFGDSRVDNGNNNNLPDPVIKANYPYYGIDFFHSFPTGRFSNGYCLSDYIAMELGHKRSPPAYESLPDGFQTSHAILHGVNFASGGSGIFNRTGSNAIGMSQQIDNFATVRKSISEMLGEERTRYFLANSIFIVASVGNDVYAFYTDNTSPTEQQIEEFMVTLIRKYRNDLKDLYDLGARKFEIIDIGPMGCCPGVRIMNADGSCVKGMNELVYSVNEEVIHMLKQLGEELAGFRYSIGSYYKLVQEATDNPTKFGYSVVDTACCGSGRLNAEVDCGPSTPYCSDRDSYLFYDRLHISQKAVRQAGHLFYEGPLEYAFPINLKQLVEAATDNNYIQMVVPDEMQ